MSAEPRQPMSQDVSSIVEPYLERVRAAMRGLDPEIVSETVDALRVHIAEELDMTHTREMALSVVDELGPAEQFAEALAGAAPVDTEPHTRRRVSGRLLGVPYDVRLPTMDRVASCWWNTRDPRVLMPRVFGIGWDVNFGALAVRLGFMLPTGYAVASVSTRRAPLNRGVSVAFAGLFSAVSAGVWGLTLLSTFTEFSAAWTPLLLVVFVLLVPAALLVVLARIGRSTEIRSDLRKVVR